ncbi:MAG: hypothetical protein R3C49_04795 [Planctomycetaceae bacterium]
MTKSTVGSGTTSSTAAKVTTSFSAKTATILCEDMNMALPGDGFGIRDRDEIHGGPGRDYLAGHPEMMPCMETTATMFSWGDNGDDFIYGGAGNDEVYGGYGNDWVFGNDGDDTINGEWGDDYLLGGAGYNVYKWDTYGNNVTYDGAAGVVGARLVNSTTIELTAATSGYRLVCSSGWESMATSFRARGTVTMQSLTGSALNGGNIIAQNGFSLATIAGTGANRLLNPNTTLDGLAVPSEVTGVLAKYGLSFALSTSPVSIRTGGQLAALLGGIPVDQSRTYVYLSSEAVQGTFSYQESAGATPLKISASSTSPVRFDIVFDPTNDFIYAKLTVKGVAIAVGLSATDQLVFSSTADFRYYDADIRGNLFVDISGINISPTQVSGVGGLDVTLGGSALLDFVGTGVPATTRNVLSQLFTQISTGTAASPIDLVRLLGPIQNLASSSVAGSLRAALPPQVTYRWA